MVASLLARTVEEARAGMGLGPLTGDPSSATPVAQIVGDDTPRIELAPKVEAQSLANATLDKLRGLRHRLPFFGRRRGG
jgi:hypothetical protein